MMNRSDVPQGQVCGGPEADAYIYTPQGYVPLAKPTVTPFVSP